MIPSRRHVKTLFATFALSLALFVLAPFSFYAQNLAFIEINFRDVLPTLLLFAVVAFALIGGLGVLLTRRLKFFPLLLAAMLAGLWVQGNLVRYDLGALNGSEIVWSAHFKRIWIEVLAWTAVFGVFFWQRKRLLKHLNTVLVLLLLLYTLPSLVTFFQQRGDVPERTYLSNVDEFKFSKKSVLVLVLDAFNASAFEQIIAENPAYQEAFKDFTLYTDAVGGYTTTRAAVPWILTGQYYLNDEPFNQYLARVERESLPAFLKTHGYRVESYPYVSYFSTLFDNQVPALPAAERLPAAVEQVVLTGIRYAPLALKPTFVARYYRGLNYAHEDLVDFDLRASETTVSGDQPLFKYIHLSGAHVPFQLDADLQWHDAGYYEQAEGSLLAVSHFLDALQAAGAYDDTLIFILGDHGNGAPMGYSNFPLASHAQALLLAKRPGQTLDGLQRSAARVTLGDLPKTIAVEAGLESKFPGYSLFGDIPTDRQRPFYYYPWETTYWSSEYLSIFYRFIIDGPANQTDSWHYLGRTPSLPPGSPEELDDQYLLEIILTETH